MKKLLILAYDFPPYVSVGGLRPYSWYKYLKEYGVEPIVVTRQWENKYGDALDYISPSATNETIIESTDYGTIIRAPFKPSLSNRIYLKHGVQKYRLLRKILTALDEIRQFISISGPKKELYKAAHNYLKKNKVDAIIATGDPFVLFYYAKKLGQEFNTPWIADYRDPWSQDESSKGLFHVFSKLVERKIVVKASFITTPSLSFKEQLSTLFPNKKIDIISNGYDNEIIHQISHIDQSKEIFTIAYAGSLYNWHPWKQFLNTLSDIIDNSEIEINLKFYGVNKNDEIKDYLKRFSNKVQKSIFLIPKMANSDLLSNLVSDNIMLLFNEYHITGTKIFDYLGVKRKILFCFEKDDKALELKAKFLDTSTSRNNLNRPQIEIIKDINAGVIVEDEHQLKLILMNLIEEFYLKGEVECESMDIEKHSRKSQLKNLINSIFLQQ